MSCIANRTAAACSQALPTIGKRMIPMKCSPQLGTAWNCLEDERKCWEKMLGEDVGRGGTCWELLSTGWEKMLGASNRSHSPVQCVPFRLGFWTHVSISRHTLDGIHLPRSAHDTAWQPLTTTVTTTVTTRNIQKHPERNVQKLVPNWFRIWFRKRMLWFLCFLLSATHEMLSGTKRSEQKATTEVITNSKTCTAVARG